MQINVSEREFYSILAGLRALQVAVVDQDISDIASNNESVRPLTAKEIDHLCEDLNTKRMLPTRVIFAGIDGFQQKGGKNEQ